MHVKLKPVATQAPRIPIANVQELMGPGVLSLAQLPPLALYVHFPWCVSKCPYCDFNSHALDHQADEDAYLDALCADLDSALPLIWGRRIISVFIGGGTPSLLSARGLDRLLSDIRARVPLLADCEITLEANPSSAEAQRFASYRQSGVTRLSLGVQSFNDASLKQLGRAHDRSQALQAAQIALNTFDRVNLDLMVGLPEQSPQQAQEDVRTAIGLGASHLSLYQLTIEPNTVFAKYPPPLPNEDCLAAIQDDLQAQAAAAGFENYEVSAFAKSGARCTHNLNYWTYGDYLGIGAGAHSKLSFPHRIVRQVRLRGPGSYLAAATDSHFLAESAQVKRQDIPFEFMLGALRLTEGVARSLFLERTGLLESCISAQLREAQDKALLEKDNNLLKTTSLGRRFLNDLMEIFLPHSQQP